MREWVLYTFLPPKIRGLFLRYPPKKKKDNLVKIKNKKWRKKVASGKLTANAPENTPSPQKKRSDSFPIHFQVRRPPLVSGRVPQPADHSTQGAFFVSKSSGPWWWFFSGPHLGRVWNWKYPQGWLCIYPGSSKYAKFQPFGRLFWWKGTNFTHLEDPGIPND